MAGIDKTYIHSLEQFKQVKDWALTVGTVIDDYGNEINPCWWLDMESSDEEIQSWFDSVRENVEKNYNNEQYIAECKRLYGDDFVFNVDDYVSIPLWNTPNYFDVWLIRNCPIDFIQERLMQQYGGGWDKNALIPKKGDEDYDYSYEAIKNYDSAYDNYKREVGYHFTIPNHKHFKDDDTWWWIDVEDMDYSEKKDCWYGRNELGTWNTNVCTTLHGNMTKRRIARLLKKWKLPIGAKVRFSGFWKRYDVGKFTITIRK